MLTTSRCVTWWLSIFIVLTAIAISGIALAAPDTVHNSLPEHCLCLSEQVSPELNWTAFKYTEKAGVSGAFSDIKVDYRHDGHTFEEFLASGSFTASVNSVTTGNPVRDETLRKSFFSLFTNEKVRGNVSNIEANAFVLNLEMNGEKKPVTFQYKVSDDGIFTASGTFDMLQYGLKQAHESIHTACDKVHTGPDGVSKTWTDVAINIKATVRRDCACS